MKSLIILFSLLNLIFAQSEFPNIGNDSHYIENPDTNLINIMYKQGIFNRNKEFFRKNVKHCFGNFQEVFYKTWINNHTDEMDTIKVITVEGFEVYYLETPAKILILNMKLKKNIKNLNQIIFHKTTMQDILKLIKSDHVFEKTEYSVCYATFSELSDTVKFIFDKNKKLIEMQWDYTID